MARKIVEYNPESLEGVVEIVPGHIYAKSPKSLRVLQKHLRDVGYNLEDTSSGERGHEKPSRKVQEKEGWALWYGKLGEKIFQRKAECGSCAGLINLRGVRCHDHKCEKCGVPTYLEYVNGGEISFSVVDNPDHDFRSLTFVIHSYDADRERLNLYANPGDCPKRRERRMRNFDRTPEECQALVPGLLKDYPQTFKLEEIKGVKLLSVNHKNDSFVHKHGINTSRTEGDIVNYREVKVFKGKKFDEFFDSIPIPESVSLYEAWHWMPLKPGEGVYEEIMSAAGQVSRKDYYYQDGRPAFGQTQIDWMLKFIKHFTTIDAGRVEPFLNTSLSGPELIDRLAIMTGDEREIETAPNIGNALTFFGKILEGQPVSSKEFREAWKGTYLDKHGNAIRKILGEDKVDDTFLAGSQGLGLDDKPEN